MPVSQHKDSGAFSPGENGSSIMRRPLAINITIVEKSTSTFRVYLPACHPDATYMLQPWAFLADDKVPKGTLESSPARKYRVWNTKHLSPALAGRLILSTQHLHWNHRVNINSLPISTKAHELQQTRAQGSPNPRYLQPHSCAYKSHILLKIVNIAKSNAPRESCSCS